MAVEQPADRGIFSFEPLGGRRMLIDWHVHINDPKYMGPKWWKHPVPMTLEHALDARQTGESLPRRSQVATVGAAPLLSHRAGLGDRFRKARLDTNSLSRIHKTASDQTQPDMPLVAAVGAVPLAPRRIAVPGSTAVLLSPLRPGRSASRQSRRRNCGREQRGGNESRCDPGQHVHFS
jgi:hypothetical protein